jgi:hypothetical protein
VMSVPNSMSIMSCADIKGVMLLYMMLPYKLYNNIAPVFGKGGQRIVSC